MLQVFSLLTLLPVLIAPAAPADRIFRKGASQPLAVQVVSEDCSVIKYKPQGVNQTLEMRADLVERIEYEDTPDSYRQALNFLEQGDAQNAVRNFQLALKSKTRGNWIEVHATYRLGIAYYLWGASDASKYRDAATQFEELMTKHPANRFIGDSLRRWGLALSRSGDAKGAAQIFDRLAQEAEAKKLGLAVEAEARILKADAFADNDMPNEASTAYREAGSFAQSNAAAQSEQTLKEQLLAIQGRSQLSQGEALLKAENWAEARRFFEQVAQSANATPTVVAGALCGIGEVLLSEKKFYEAYGQFALVRIRHYLARNETARATFFMGVCCSENSKEPNGKRKANDYFKEVTDRYADTVWADRARSKLR